MICRNCGNINPEGVMICENCGADLRKSLPIQRHPTRHRRITSFGSCVSIVFSSTIIFALIVLTIAAVLVFNCVIALPSSAESEYAGFLRPVWEQAEIMQTERCIE